MAGGWQVLQGSSADEQCELMSLWKGSLWLWVETGPSGRQEEKPDASLQGVVMIRERGGAAEGLQEGAGF